MLHAHETGPGTLERPVSEGQKVDLLCVTHRHTAAQAQRGAACCVFGSCCMPLKTGPGTLQPPVSEGQKLDLLCVTHRHPLHGVGIQAVLGTWEPTAC